MQNKMKSFKLLLLIVVLLAGQKSFSQEKKGTNPEPDYHYYIANINASGKVLEFDLLLLNTRADKPFELASIQAGILINPAFCGSGNITASIIPSTSDLSSSQAPTVITFVQKKYCIKIAAKSPPGYGNGSIISTNPEKPARLCRVRLTSTEAFANVAPDPRFCLMTRPYPTKLSRYDHETKLNTALEVNSYSCYTANNKNSREVAITQSNTQLMEKLSIYPNPNNGSFTLTFKGTDPTIYEIMIVNQNGSIVFKRSEIKAESTLSQEIALGELPEGTYTLTLSNIKDQISKKFVIKK